MENFRGNLTGLNKLKFLNKNFFETIHASKGKRDSEKFKGYIYSIPG